MLLCQPARISGMNPDFRVVLRDPLNPSNQTKINTFVSVYLKLGVFLRHGSKVSFNALSLLSLQGVEPNQSLLIHGIV